MSDYTLETQGNKRFYQNSGIERLTELLHENGIDEKRFVKLREGTKKSYTDHTEPYNQYRPHDIEGNYGVLAGFGLLELDVDDYKDGEEIPPLLLEWINKSPTYRVRTPHRGNHLYYPVPTDAPERIKEVCGKHNPKLGAVEVKSKNSLVVGPGSELDGCTKEECNNCSKQDGGHYKTDSNFGLNPNNDFERFIEVVDELTEEPEPDTSQYESSPGEITLQTDAVEWIENAREWDPKLNQLMECLGDSVFRPKDYPELEYTDRSANEVALANKIMRRIGSFEDFEENTYQIIDQLNPPKWSECGESYRKSVLKSAKAKSTDIGEFYQAESDSGKSGGVIQWKAERIILIVKYNMGEKFTTSDVAKLVEEIGERHTRKVLNHLKEAGFLTKTFVKDNEHFKKVTEIDTTGKTFEMFINQYNTPSEVEGIRSDYLSQNSDNDSNKQDNHATEQSI